MSILISELENYYYWEREVKVCNKWFYLKIQSYLIRVKKKKRKVSISSENSLNFSCCICRREILRHEEIIQCSKCQTYYHANHLSFWLNKAKNCPVCHCYLYQPTSFITKSKKRDRKIRKGKLYRCYYCNHSWKANSSGYQLWCPECGITSCSNCKNAFNFQFLLGYIQTNGNCPNCNKHITLETLKAKVTAITD